MRSRPQHSQVWRRRLPRHDRPYQLHKAKLRPQARLPVQECMAALPQQKVREPLLPRGSYHEVNRGAVLCICVCVVCACVSDDTGSVLFKQTQLRLQICGDRCGVPE